YRSGGANPLLVGLSNPAELRKYLGHCTRSRSMNSRIISAVAVYPAPSSTVELALWISMSPPALSGPDASDNPALHRGDAPGAPDPTAPGGPFRYVCQSFIALPRFC